ncbi:CBS domain-containing protein [Natronolimnohabitans innermongolicus]|nr:CBS domain-containing protein [Natronolimnohabitans innermongolicus]
MAVIDITRETVVTADPETTLAELVDTMQSNRVGSVVVTEDGEPVGLVSDRDLAFAVLGGTDVTSETPVETIVSEPLVTVDAETGLYELLGQMSERGVRRVPVVEDGELAGIVSLSDIVVLLGMELQQVANIIRSVSPAYEQSAIDY